jgi:DNA-binding response OmpR family regulator
MGETAVPPPPRVLLIMPEQWPRALLRAALREVGYDALGAPSLAAALSYRPQAADRGPVRLILLDQDLLSGKKIEVLLGRLLRGHGNPALLLLARSTAAQPLFPAGAPVAWRVIKRPVSVADLVAAVRAAVPLSGPARPID